ncbi:hypothetical protein HJC23_011061 [Cyclotella cryptica]|uniref:Derlin n=1 Tax=Cyclotella cryptica TaxID=29204 RepID=A0ABD3PB39_9STRA
MLPTVRDRALQHWCRRRTADYIFALMFGMSTIFVTYPLLGKLLPILPLFARTLTFFVIYVWSKRHPTAPASIWGVEMKAIHLLFAYLVLTVLMGNPYADRMWMLFPSSHGKDVLHTPQFLIDRLGVGAYVPPAEVPGARGGAAQGSNVWRPPGRANAPQDPA